MKAGTSSRQRVRATTGDPQEGELAQGSRSTSEEADHRSQEGVGRNMHIAGLVTGELPEDKT